MERLLPCDRGGGRQFGGHSFKLLLGASYEEYDYYSLGAYRQEFAYPDYEVISAGGDNEFKDNSGSRTQMALGSFFGRINYNFKERYLFEANLRYDGSSRFVRKNRWSAFPSFSAAWRVTEEPFMAAARKTLSEFKIRASYGTLGNQNINSYYPASQLLTISSISAANKIYPIVAQNSLANEDITWETTYMTDIGFDATLWNRLSITADYYHKKTDGILMQLDIPPPSDSERPTRTPASSPTTAGRFPSDTTTVGAISTSACRQIFPTSSTRLWT